MRSRTVLLLFLISIVALCEGSTSQSVEARGKNKNQGHYELWIYFADLVVKKVFILKLVYAFVLWCVLHKAGYFLSWFVSYLKQQKKEHGLHDHGPHDHGHHDHYPGSYGSYGPYRKSYKTR